MLKNIISELIDSKNIHKKDLVDIIKTSLLAVYEKKFPGIVLRINMEKSENEIFIEVEKQIVATVKDDLNEISLRKAKNINSSFALGDKIWLEFEEKIGRIEISKAKQLIVNKIRDLEIVNISKEFESKIGELIQGIINKTDKNGVSVLIQDKVAYLPKSLSIPNEKYIAGRPLRALIKEVYSEYRSNGQIILDRASKEFFLKLFELEIPEVYDKIIEVKAIARKAGYKTKIIVNSKDKNIDALGTCIGINGSRIRPLLKELSGEKIDLISWNNTKEELVKSALKPAEINKVEIKDSKAIVWISEDQRAYAIGKMGQNIRLAAELLNLEIDLVSSTNKNDIFVESGKAAKINLNEQDIADKENIENENIIKIHNKK